MWFPTLTRGQQSSSAEGQRVNIFSFADHMVFVAATQHCRDSVKAATDSMEMSERGCVPGELS